MKKWFALYTKPRCEFKALEQLTEIGIDVYLPTITTTKQWSDRKKKLKEPLFRGYIFICSNEIERNNAITREAIIKTIFFDGKPAVIPNREIENLKMFLENPKNVVVFDGITKGVIVQIESGPFKGVEGVVNSISKDENTLSISVEMLNRTVVAVIPSTTKVKRIN